MKLRLNVDEMTQMPARCDAFRTVGTLRSARGVLRARLAATVGELCDVVLPGDRRVTAEVVGFDERESMLMCFDGEEGLKAGLDVISLGRKRTIPVGNGVLGRVLDGVARPIDGQGPLDASSQRLETAASPAAMTRSRIEQPLVTGQRVVDGLLTIGFGQRVGLFAGSGVGKSTLLGEIAKGATADINVIALVGERGREVRPFIEDCLGPEGLKRSVVVVATSDDTPLLRIKAVTTAITIAEEFRDQGANVLFFLDSLTRLAMAQRELGLLLGEPPGARGYPPSVQSLMARVLERLGPGDTGTITGLITVLVDGDDLDEPITDAARSILDGHIVLSRDIASQGRYPAVDVPVSISRLFRELSNEPHRSAAASLRSILSTYNEMSDLIQIGAYKQGTSPRIDRAIQLMPAVNRFLSQEVDERSSWEETMGQLQALNEAWAS